MYVRNDNTTHLLSGDVRGIEGQGLLAALNLKAGPVGIVIPLRGSGVEEV